MAYRSFSHFLEELGRASELVRVTEPVATELEITELADRQMKTPGGGKAQGWQRVPGVSFGGRGGRCRTASIRGFRSRYHGPSQGGGGGASAAGAPDACLASGDGR